MAIKFTGVVAAGPGWVTVTADDGNTYTLKGQNAWRSNNPGNLSYSSEAKALAAGAIGVEYPHGSELPVAIFPDLATGEAAREALLTSPAYSDLTIAQAAAKWSTSSYGPALAKAAGVPISTKISDLTQDQLNAIFAQQRISEGNTPGTITAANGQTVPPDVAAQFSGHPTPSSDVPGSIAEQVAAAHDRRELAAGGADTGALYAAAGSPVPMPARPASMTSLADNPLPAPPVLVAPKMDSVGQPLPSFSDFQKQLGGAPAAAPTVAPVTVAPSQPAQPMVRLAGGGMITVGLHPSPDGTHMESVTDDGHGNAIVTKQLNIGEVPGVINPLSEKNAPTMAGGYIRQMIQQAKDSPEAAAALSGVSTAAQNVGETAANMAGGLKDAAGGIFTSIFGGGGSPTVAPAMNSTGAKALGTDDVVRPSSAAPASGRTGTPDLLDVVKTRAAAATGKSIIPDNQLPAEQQANFDDAMRLNGYRDIQEQMYNPKPAQSPSSTSVPTVAPAYNPSDRSGGGNHASPTDMSSGGSHLNPTDMSSGGVSAGPTAATAPTKATTTYTTTQETVENPAYTAWKATQGGLSTGTSQNTVSSKFDGEDSTLMGSAAPVVAPLIPGPNDTDFTGPKTITVTKKVPVVTVAPVKATPAAAAGPGKSADSSGQYAYLNGGAAAHAALMAKQHNGVQIDQNGNPVKAMDGSTQRANPYVNSFGMVT